MSNIIAQIIQDRASSRMPINWIDNALQEQSIGLSARLDKTPTYQKYIEIWFEEAEKLKEEYTKEGLTFSASFVDMFITVNKRNEINPD